MIVYTVLTTKLLLLWPQLLSLTIKIAGLHHTQMLQTSGSLDSVSPTKDLDVMFPSEDKQNSDVDSIVNDGDSSQRIMGYIQGLIQTINDFDAQVDALQTRIVHSKNNEHAQLVQNSNSIPSFITVSPTAICPAFISCFTNPCS